MFDDEASTIQQSLPHRIWQPATASARSTPPLLSNMYCRNLKLTKVKSTVLYFNLQLDNQALSTRVATNFS